MLQDEDVSKANTILLTLVKNDAAGKKMLRGFEEALASGRARSNTTVKCSHDKDGKFEFEFATGVGENLRPVIISRTRWHAEQMPAAKSPVEKLHAGVKACIGELERASKGVVVARATIFSDDDRGVDERVDGSSSAAGGVAMKRPADSKPEVDHVETSKANPVSGQAELLHQRFGRATVRNSFDEDPAYTRMNSGRTENGIVAHLPTSHIFGNAHDIDNPVNQMNLPKSFSSELDVLTALRAKNAKHVFPEGMDSDSCKFYNGASAIAASNPEFRTVCDQFARIASGIDAGKSAEELLGNTSKDAKKWFLDMGGAAVHVILSQAGASPARMYVTTTPELQARIASIQANPKTQSGAVLISGEEMELVFKTREEFLAGAISKAPLNGEPAFVPFGSLHTFQNVFKGPDSPALFRLVKPGA